MTTSFSHCCLLISSEKHRQQQKSEGRLERASVDFVTCQNPPCRQGIVLRGGGWGPGTAVLKQKMTLRLHVRWRRQGRALDR